MGGGETTAGSVPISSSRLYGNKKNWYSFLKIILTFECQSRKNLQTAFLACYHYRKGDHWDHYRKKTLINTTNCEQTDSPQH